MRLQPSNNDSGVLWTKGDRASHEALVARDLWGRNLAEGHTDDVPISSTKFPSNWVLSSARASSVASHLLSKSQIKKSRISVVGKADTQPISNKREENRRIEIKVL